MGQKGLPVISPNNRTIFYSVILVLLAIIVTIPDVVFDFTVSLFHTLFNFFLDLLHTLFETVEMALDNLVEHQLHTDLKETQLIVFYIMLSMGLGLAYVLLRLLFRFYRHCKSHLLTLWVEEKSFITHHWLGTSATTKILLASVLTVIAYLFFLISF